MWDVLSAVGLPVEFVNVIRCFYKHNAHFIKVSNGLHAGPGLYAGARQGCLLSGLMFAICVVVLLYRINRVFGKHELLRAYADDIALVLMDYQKSASAIAIIFEEFAAISALKLNINKTVFIPLWPFCFAEHVQRFIRDECPDIHVDNKGELLGAFVGQAQMTHHGTSHWRNSCRRWIIGHSNTWDCIGTSWLSTYFWCPRWSL